MIRENVDTAVLVVGLGNPLMGDDGFGCAVVDTLKNQILPSSVTAEAVPDVLHLRSVWRGQPAVWIVDTIARQDDPGTIHRFDHEMMLGLPEYSGTAHHLEFGVCLRWLLHAFPQFRSVQFRLWGAEPSGVFLRPALSAPVAAAVMPVVREIQALAANAPGAATARSASLAGR